MNLFDHTTSWCKGEIAEGTKLSLFGGGISLVSVGSWLWGTGSLWEFLVVPLGIIGLLHILAGFYLRRQNRHRLADFASAFQQNPFSFAQEEKSRAEESLASYRSSRIIFGGLSIVAILLLSLAPSMIWQAAGIGLLVLGVSALVVDHFSAGRTRTYLEAIEASFSL
ncbi:MAG: hypothetical protein AAFR61_11800 [Bacteroidota bacterium]